MSLVITDPPYADNVNYAELADFFTFGYGYIMAQTIQHFTPEEVTPKWRKLSEESARGRRKDFEEGLSGCI